MVARCVLASGGGDDTSCTAKPLSGKHISARMQLQGLLESRCMLAREKNVLGTNVVFAPSCPVGKSQSLWLGMTQTTALLCPRGNLLKESLPKGKLGSNMTFLSSTMSFL